MYRAGHELLTRWLFQPHSQRFCFRVNASLPVGIRREASDVSHADRWCVFLHDASSGMLHKCVDVEMVSDQFVSHSEVLVLFASLFQDRIGCLRRRCFSFLCCVAFCIASLSDAASALFWRALQLCVQSDARSVTRMLGTPKDCTIGIAGSPSAPRVPCAESDPSFLRAPLV
jgi:hypothetical protein